jgi:hypothetical protein
MLGCKTPLPLGGAHHPPTNLFCILDSPFQCPICDPFRPPLPSLWLVQRSQAQPSSSCGLGHMALRPADDCRPRLPRRLMVNDCTLLRRPAGREAPRAQSRLLVGRRLTDDCRRGASALRCTRLTCATHLVMNSPANRRGLCKVPPAQPGAHAPQAAGAALFQKLPCNTLDAAGARACRG